MFYIFLTVTNAIRILLSVASVAKASYILARCAADLHCSTVQEILKSLGMSYTVAVADIFFHSHEHNQCIVFRVSLL